MSALSRAAVAALNAAYDERFYALPLAQRSRSTVTRETAEAAGLSYVSRIGPDEVLYQDADGNQVIARFVSGGFAACRAGGRR